MDIVVGHKSSLVYKILPGISVSTRESVEGIELSSRCIRIPLDIVKQTISTDANHTSTRFSC